MRGHLPKVQRDIRGLARDCTELAINTLRGIASNGINESARVSAAVALLDRGWGKAPQAHTGENGEGDIRVTIRHIIEGVDAPREAKVIDAKTRKPLVIDGDEQ